MCSLDGLRLDYFLSRLGLRIILSLTLGPSSRSSHHYNIAYQIPRLVSSNYIFPQGSPVRSGVLVWTNFQYGSVNTRRNDPMTLGMLSFEQYQPRCTGF